jgi:hypothetical protein
MSSYLQQSYLGAWDDDRPEGFVAKLGWGLKTSAKAVGGAFASGAQAVATGAKDLVTGTDATQRAQAEAVAAAKAKAAAEASAKTAARTRNLVILGALAVGAYFYFKRK